jgi:hypothetical protein
LPIRFAVLLPVITCFPALESKNFNYLVLILSCLARDGRNASSREPPAPAADARGAESTTVARAFAADLLQVQQSEISDSIHDCG